MDVTRVYHLPLQALRALETNDHACRFVLADTAELRRLIANADIRIDEALLKLQASGEVICFTATQGMDLLGYVWFAEKEVDPRHNTGGPQFKGIGLTLDAGVCYLFKAFIAPRFRGQQLMSRMIRAACETLSKRGFDKIVTTTDIDNQAFQKSIERIGFVMVGRAAEMTLFNRHAFCLPRLDDRVTLRRGD